MDNTVHALFPVVSCLMLQACYLIPPAKPLPLLRIAALCNAAHLERQEDLI